MWPALTVAIGAGGALVVAGAVEHGEAEGCGLRGRGRGRGWCGRGWWGVCLADEDVGLGFGFEAGEVVVVGFQRGMDSVLLWWE